MSRRSRHGRRPQSSTSGMPEPRSDVEPVATAMAADVAPAPAPAPAPPRPQAAPVMDDAPEPVAVAEPPEIDPSRGPTCTQAQLRRFIKSRPWIPMHELRRRFGIMGGDDDVTPVKTSNGMIFVGLPPAEGRLLGELLISGDVGYELSLDPGAPIVVGVYPMRPVARG
jgi:hypothetical protein